MNCDLLGTKEQLQLSCERLVTRVILLLSKPPATGSVTANILEYEKEVQQPVETKAETKAELWC